MNTIKINKIESNGYDNAEEAINNEMPYADTEDYYIYTFGF
jgi:hypothetical protein